MTTMQMAMAKAGFGTRAESRFRVALAEYLNNGGTLERARQIVDEIELPGGGLAHRAVGQGLHAPAWQPNGDGMGHNAVAGNGHGISARPSPTESSTGGHTTSAGKAADMLPPAAATDREGAGHFGRAPKAGEVMPAPREPSAADRRAMAMVARSIAGLHFEITLRQGSKMAIGDIYIESIGRLHHQVGRRTWVSSREYNLLTLLKAHAENQAFTPPGAKVRDVLTDAEADKMIALATEMATPITAKEAADAAE